jgi:hypothetical protein
MLRAMPRSRLGLLSALIALGAPAVASGAPDAGALIARADKMVSVELRYGEAIDLLSRALSEPEISTRQRIDAYRLLGIAYVARGATGSATAAFTELLDLDPDYGLDPLLSPKIHEVFAKAKAQRAAKERAGKESAPPPVAPDLLPPVEEVKEREPELVPPAVIAPRPVEPTERSIVSEWWFWAAIAGAVAIGVSGAILLPSGDAPLPRGTLDPIVIE